LDDLARAIELSPNYEYAYAARGRVELTLRKYQAVLDDTTRAVSIAPRYAEPYLLRGLAKLETGDLIGALTDTSISITLDTTNAEAYLARGLVYLALNEPNNARHDFSKAGEISPRLLEEMRRRQTEKET